MCNAIRIWLSFLYQNWDIRYAFRSGVMYLCTCLSSKSVYEFKFRIIINRSYSLSDVNSSRVGGHLVNFISNILFSSAGQNTSFFTGCNKKIFIVPILEFASQQRSLISNVFTSSFVLEHFIDSVNSVASHFGGKAIWYRFHGFAASLLCRPCCHLQINCAGQRALNFRLRFSWRVPFSRYSLRVRFHVVRVCRDTYLCISKVFKDFW